MNTSPRENLSFEPSRRDPFRAGLDPLLFETLSGRSTIPTAKLTGRVPPRPALGVRPLPRKTLDVGKGRVKARESSLCGTRSMWTRWALYLDCVSRHNVVASECLATYRGYRRLSYVGSTDS